MRTRRDPANRLHLVDTPAEYVAEVSAATLPDASLPDVAPDVAPDAAPDATLDATAGAAGVAFGHGESALPARPVHTALAAGHATELVAPPPASLFATLLDLTGAEHGGVQQTLVAWQREQDRLLNRTWRRPGGLARPAGL